MKIQVLLGSVLVSLEAKDDQERVIVILNMNHQYMSVVLVIYEIYVDLDVFVL